jgi:ATP-dependent DNA helicase DinG
MDIASTFQKCREGPKRSWIFTSATLSIRNSLQHFMDSLGLQTAQTMVLPSPFSYEEQALMFVPAKAPPSNSPEFSEKLCELLWPLLKVSNGGVFYLCTTLRAVSKVGQWLAERIAQDKLDWTILVQGQASKGEMLDQFRRAKHPILVGSASFWEGVDVKGERLRLVIIDKLPFAPPDDPISAARGHWLREQGGNPFMDLSVPEAVIALKQGAGRLIRDEQDRGILVIGDRRIIDKPYGRILWQSLPPFRRTQELDIAVQMMDSIVGGGVVG